MSAASLPAERKAVLFTSGGIRLALRLSQVREVVAVEDDVLEVVLRGATIPAVPVAVALGLQSERARFAVVTEAVPPCALKVEEVHGILDLGAAEVFHLPTRTQLPQPPPFQGALVDRGEVALELAIATLGWAPIEPAFESACPPPELEFPIGRELLFSRAGRTYAVPIELLEHVLDAPRVFPVPLAPVAHRGIVYYGRAIHPVFDLAVLYGDEPTYEWTTALLVDAGGNAVAVLADRILHAGEAVPGNVARPSWDVLFAGP